MLKLIKIAYCAALVPFLCIFSLHSVCELCPSAKVIFVNSSNTPGPGAGTYANPYQSLTFALEDPQSGPCDVIYVMPGTYDANDSVPSAANGFQLQNNQRLLSTTLEAYQRCPVDCAIPVLTNSVDGGLNSVVLLAENNEVSGFSIVNTGVSKAINFGITNLGMVTPTDIKRVVISDNNFIINGTPDDDALAIGIGIDLSAVGNSTNVEISNCTFTFQGTTLANNDAGIFMLGNRVNFLATNNTYTNNSSPYADFYGTSLSLTGHVTITNSQFIANSSGILIQGANESSGATRFSILNNTIFTSDRLAADPIVPIPMGIYMFKNDGGIWCADVSYNTVISRSSSTVGYRFTTYPEGITLAHPIGSFLLDFDNSNVGTFQILPNIETVFNQLGRITYDSGCK